MNNNLIHAFFSKVKENKHSITFMDRKGKYTSYTYEAIWNEAVQYAGYFKDKGIKEGDVVALMLPTSLGFLGAFFGAQMIKATPVSLYPPLSLADLEQWKKSSIIMMKQTDAKVLVTDNKISSFLYKDVISENMQLFLVEDIVNKKVNFELDMTKYTEDDMCFLQFSSGTTSAPKPVMITHRNAMSNVRAIIDGIDMNGKDFVCVSWLPLYHDMGLVGQLLSSIVCGGELVLIRPDDFIRKPFLWLKAISDYKGTITAAPNFAFGLATKRISKDKIESLDLSSVKISLCGAEMIHKETMDKFLSKFGECGFSKNAITAGYGMAESTVSVTIGSPTEEVVWKTFSENSLGFGKAAESEEGVTICSVGAPLKTITVEIRDAAGKNLPDGRVGRIFVQGTSVSSGYLYDDKKTALTMPNGVLDSGDQGFMYQGQLYICGRVKDTIIIRGKNYYPTSFEEKLYELPEIREGRVVVSSVWCEESDTEVMIVLAELKNKRMLEDTRKIKESIQRLTSEAGMMPRYVDVVAPGVLPRTSSGKLKRREAVRLWESNKLIQGKTRLTKFSLGKRVLAGFIYRTLIRKAATFI